MTTAESVAIPPRYADGHKRKPHRRRHAGANNMWRKLQDNWDDIVRIGADPTLGTVVGRLYLFGVLSDLEATAARRYAEIVGRHDRYQGLSARQAVSPSYERGYGREDEVGRREQQGTIVAYERRARRARREWDRLQRVIPNDTARSALNDVCVHNREIPSAHHPDLKALLRIIAGLYGGRERQDAPPQRSPVAQIVNVALGSLVAWFRENGSQVEGYSLLANLPDGAVGIMGFGPAPAGAELHSPGSDCGELRHSVSIKRGKIMAEVFAAAFVKAAERMQWAERK